MDMEFIAEKVKPIMEQAGYHSFVLVGLAYRPTDDADVLSIDQSYDNITSDELEQVGCVLIQGAATLHA